MLKRSRRDPDAALRQFGRVERGFLDKVRLESLDEQLRRDGPRTVLRTSWTMGGNRSRVELDDGTQLRLWLYWQGEGELASITRVYFEDEVGWMIYARRPSGEVVRLVAFRIRVELTTGDRGRTGSNHA